MKKPALMYTIMSGIVMATAYVFTTFASIDYSDKGDDDVMKHVASQTSMIKAERELAKEFRREQLKYMRRIDKRVYELNKRGS